MFKPMAGSTIPKWKSEIDHLDQLLIQFGYFFKAIHLKLLYGSVHLVAA